MCILYNAHLKTLTEAGFYKENKMGRIEYFETWYLFSFENMRLLENIFLKGNP